MGILSSSIFNVQLLDVIFKRKLTLSIILHSPILQFSILTFIVEHGTWNKSISFFLSTYPLRKQYVSCACADGARTAFGDGWLLGLGFFFVDVAFFHREWKVSTVNESAIRSKRNPLNGLARKQTRNRQGTWTKECVHLMCSANTTWIMRMWECT